MSENIVAKFVQVEQEAVLIDSRVYCREIIQVEHGDWMQNILYKYQTLIEQRFGIIRFQNGITGKRGKPEKYALLNEPQCNFALALSNNSEAVVLKKADLIADFEQAKQQIKLNFERSLSASVVSPSKLIQAESRFPKSCQDVLSCTGISRRDTVIKATKQYLIENKDYQVESQGNWDLYFYTQEAFEWLSIFHRSKVGLDPDLLPTHININPRDIAKPTTERKNQVFPKYRDVELF